MNRDKLNELLDRVKAATGPDRELDADLAQALEGVDIQWRQANGTMEMYPVQRYASTSHMAEFGVGPVPDFTASIDAALTLVERCLPGQHITMGRNVHHHYWLCTFNYLNEDGKPASNAQQMHKSSLPLAILAALLTALTPSNDTQEE